MALLFLLIVSMPAGLESVQELEELAVGPGIAADRWSGLYIKGESVGVYCSSHGLPRGGIFYLCKVGEVTCLTPKRGSNSSDGARFTLTNVSVNVSGMYVCIYQMWRSGTFTNATGRETVNINVTGKLPAAHISLDPLPSADPHSRILQCSSPRDFPVTAFLFYQIEKESAIDTIPPLLFDPSEASLATRAIKAEGNYSCRYKVNVCGIVYSSPSSQTLEVLIFGDGQLRLTGGPDLCSGRLEVWHWGSWGTVCRAGWGQAEAEVVCQHLGCGFTSWRSNRRYYGRATGPIWLRKVTCRDTERSLWSCSLWSYNIAEYCSHRNDVEVSCIGQPKEPSVSTARSTWGFIEGENITIQCTCLPLYTGSTFYLSKVNQPRFQLTMMASEAENKVTFIIPNGTISQSGLYLCLYQIQRRGITYNSTASGITVKVHEIASTPMISMDRLTGVYLVGETPVIFCRGLHVKPDRFYLYETTANPVLIDELSPKVWRASFTLDTKNRTGEFRYMCTYRVAVADHYVNSTTSTALKIVVTGELPKPQIYLESPTVFFTQYRKVTCSIVSLFGRAEFYLYKAGTPAHFDSSTANRRTSSTTFSVSNMNRTNSGTYTCRYQVETSGRVINSPWSEPLELDIGKCERKYPSGNSHSAM
ncbi:uncharacterized protein LOC119968048 [Scyliorhinus canicula]|uniref:uncharacterized protein LOC119968048 n=1 Tax=Scyliorhinus canicula TaxID=7830 RepID=UPI0018F5C8D5|nr:uncharacterized protein LOC119968048 [Scyliorhinus canicula]